MVDLKFSRKRPEFCPCGKSNKNGKFASFEGHEDKGYCHSCGKTFFPGNPGERIAAFKQEFKRSEYKHPFEAKTSFYGNLRRYWKGLGYDLNENLVTIDGKEAFVYRDHYGKLVNYKITKYKDNGKRDKDRFPFFKHKTADGFGSVLFNLDRYKLGEVINVVESEKTALICEAVLGGIWMASGGASGMTRDKAWDIRANKVVLWYDCDDAGREGARKAKRNLEEFNSSVTIKDLDPSRSDGYDLGDKIEENL